MTGPSGADDLPSWEDLLGIDLPEERLAGNLRAYREILDALRKLRGLDLTGVHPAVTFDPTAPYEEGELP